MPWSLYSQFNQDSRLSAIFSIIGTTNELFVEFGSPQSGGNATEAPNEKTDLMSNTKMFEKVNHWKGLIMDGGEEKPAINLHQEWITKDNVVSLFDKYKVPREADLVSIDIDSCDLWVFYNLTKVYRPRVVLVESDPFFKSSEAMTEKCGFNGPAMPEPDAAAHITKEGGWSSWGFSEMGIYGGSHKAFRLAARENGYTPVLLDDTSCEDIYLLRDDLICNDEDSHQLFASLRSNFENMHHTVCADWRLEGNRDDDGKRLAPKYVLDFSKWLAENSAKNK
jgi:hypothetical protein